MAMEIEVRYPFERATGDEQIAKRATWLAGVGSHDQ
jgi:hypothetical protein